VTLGDFPARLEQVRGKELANKIQWDDPVGHPQLSRMREGPGNLSVIMFSPIIETKGSGHRMVGPRPIERRHRIHPTGAKHDDFHD